jgi:hypothetical protein
MITFGKTEKWQSWFNALVLKTSVRENVPGVRIPPSPHFLPWQLSEIFYANLFRKRRSGRAGLMHWS